MHFLYAKSVKVLLWEMLNSTLIFFIKKKEAYTASEKNNQVAKIPTLSIQPLILSLP